MATTIDRPPAMVSIGVAARRLGCCVETIRRMEARGEIPPALRGEGVGLRLYSPDDVEAIRRRREERAQARRVGGAAPEVA